MENIRIFCEGVSDQRFLRDFIFLNYDIEISDKQLKKNEIIHNLGGWTNLKNLKNKIFKLEKYEFSDGGLESGRQRLARSSLCTGKKFEKSIF